jgi:hypothetical protein
MEPSHPLSPVLIQPAKLSFEGSRHPGDVFVHDHCHEHCRRRRSLPHKETTLAPYPNGNESESNLAKVNRNTWRVNSGLSGSLPVEELPYDQQGGRKIDPDADDCEGGLGGQRHGGLVFGKEERERMWR